MAEKQLLKVMEMPDGDSYIFNATQLDDHSYEDIVKLMNGAVVLKGTLGTGGTINDLPPAEAKNLGYAYKVIAAGTYQNLAAKYGDLFICYESGKDSYEWMLIPAGDDIEDTGATSVEVTGTGNAITSASYNATTRKITFTKGSTFLTSHQSLAAYVKGPASSTDNAIARYDGTTGKIIQNSTATISDKGHLSIDTTSDSTMTTPAVNILHTGPKDGTSYADLMILSGFSQAPYGFKFRTYGDGTAIIQSQRIGNDSDTFPLSLNPNGKPVLINGNTAWHAGNDGSGSGLDADLLDGKHAISSLTATDDNNVPTSKAVADYIDGLGYVTGSYLPLAGGEMKGPIDFEDKANASGKNKNYISAGGGYGATSGLEGLKILALNQSNARMGMGVDLTGGSYELTIATGRDADSTASKIGFATHTTGKTAYKTLGYFTASGKENPVVTFNVAGTIQENGTALSSKYLGISAKAADSDKLDGQEGSYYLNYNNFTNKPIIPNPANYYWANIRVSLTSSTATTPSVQKIGITGSTTTTAAAAVTLEYDSSYKALKFVFA